ncbi:hypothetical protein [Nitrosospira sp. Is2]|uniref:hypothetical protein n=1 Tax=Nitrosospira sp. Is2 TaxID=3080532 RepID=UPI002955BC6D|nr:hypothetical protein [Nitrosospira sp. Is2]WON75340.1 hypothetical protein R5L00_07670 [Nitrosospira sp. Is2]
MHLIGDLVFISPGSGYNAEDIAEAGEDMTHSFIKGPPGFKAGRFVFSAKIFSWITEVLAAVVGARIAKWLGWV